MYIYTTSTGASANQYTVVTPPVSNNPQPSAPIAPPAPTNPQSGGTTTSDKQSTHYAIDVIA